LTNYIYLITTSIYLYGDYSDMYHLTLLKPIPILLLFTKAISQLNTFYHSSITKGLVFSIIGDILLMFDDEIHFKIGTLSFLIAHLYYIHAFLNDYKS